MNTEKNTLEKHKSSVDSASNKENKNQEKKTENETKKGCGKDVSQPSKSSEKNASKGSRKGALVGFDVLPQASEMLENNYIRTTNGISPNYFIHKLLLFRWVKKQQLFGKKA